MMNRLCDLAAVLFAIAWSIGFGVVLPAVLVGWAFKAMGIF